MPTYRFILRKPICALILCALSVTKPTLGQAQNFLPDSQLAHAIGYADPRPEPEQPAPKKPRKIKLFSIFKPWLMLKRDDKSRSKVRQVSCDNDCQECKLDSPELRRMGCTLGQQLTYRRSALPSRVRCGSRCTNDCCAVDCYSANCGCTPLWMEDRTIDDCCRETTIKGWVSGGYTANGDEPAFGLNRPLQFNDKHNEFQLNQLYLFLDSPAQYGCCWDVGGRVDLLYGSDYFFTQSLGLETHQSGPNRWNRDEGVRGGANRGLALPQMYAEIFAPIGNGLLFKAGHFYSPMGYESVMSPSNFFYSRSLTYSYGEPRTFTGMLASYVYSENTAIHGGFSRGINAYEDPDPSDGLSVLAGLNWKSDSGRTQFSAWINSGDEPSLLSQNENMTNYSLVLQHEFNHRWSGAMQHVLGALQDGELTNQLSIDTAKFYGFAAYLFYEVSDEVTAGVRAEWFVDQDHLRIPVFPIEPLTKGGNYYTVSLGLNWQPYENLTIRPEVRWDWSDAAFTTPTGEAAVFDDFNDQDQFTVAIDFIFSL